MCPRKPPSHRSPPRRLPVARPKTVQPFYQQEPRGKSLHNLLFNPNNVQQIANNVRMTGTNRFPCWESRSRPHLSRGAFDPAVNGAIVHFSNSTAFPSTATCVTDSILAPTIVTMTFEPSFSE